MKDKSGKVLIAAPVHDILIEGLTGMGYECSVHETISQKTVYTLVQDCVGVVTSTRLQLDKGLIDAAPALRWIARMGSGMEVIDMEYAAAKNIACYGSPEGNCNAVGEHALGMLLTLTRHIDWSHKEMLQGIWRREENRGIELEGKTIAIIGYGHTGQAFAKKLQGFDMRILAYDKYNANTAHKYAEYCASLTTVYEQADMISFHVPLQADTLHYFNEDFLQQMKKPFIIINTSRGVVVDTAAVQKGLLSGKITGACLDVFEQEPITAMEAGMRRSLDEIMALPNVVATPHIAGYTYEALYKMSKVLLQKITAGPF